MLDWVKVVDKFSRYEYFVEQMMQSLVFANTWTTVKIASGNYRKYPM